MDETSKNDSSELASQITGNRVDDPKGEFHSQSDDAEGSHQLQLEILHEIRRAFCRKV